VTDDLADPLITPAATFSPCRTWRYYLVRRFGPAPTLVTDWQPLVVVMLNPSTADETKDDPTIRRVIGFAKAWGHTELHVLNLFALRATNPKALKVHADPVGPENDSHLETWIRWSRCAAVGGAPVLAAWGAHGNLMSRGFRVRHQIGDELAGSRITPVRWICLGKNADGTPVHPLYVPADRKPEPFGY
jgi:hypothetical protein